MHWELNTPVLEYVDVACNRCDRFQDEAQGLPQGAHPGHTLAHKPRERHAEGDGQGDQRQHNGHFQDTAYLEAEGYVVSERTGPRSREGRRRTTI